MLALDLANEMWQDARYAVRGLRRSPGFTAVAVASLALGIGATNAIFSLMETVALKMLPVRQPGQLVELLQKYPNEARGNGYWSWRSFEYFRDQNQVFASLFGTNIDNRARLEMDGVEPRNVVRESVTGNYFAELGLQPAIGRLIAPQDRSAGRAETVAVVSWRLWNSRFARDPKVLGKKITVGGVPAAIVGVAPRAYVGLRQEAQTDVWLPQAAMQNGLTMLARLKPGVTLAQARAQATALFQFTIDERSAGSQDPLIRRLRVEVEPAGNGLSSVRDRYLQPLQVLMTVVGLLLLLVCVNLASMLLARATGRVREMAVRTSLGASRGRLLRQALTEALALSLAGTAAGVLVAFAGTAVLLRILASGREHERVALQVQPDLQMLLFGALIALVAGLLFGAAPAWNAFRTPPAAALRQSGGASEARFGRLFRNGLVSVQIALSLLLMTGAGLLVGNLANLAHADLGFRRDHILMVSMDPGRGLSSEQVAQSYQQMLGRMEKIPGVQSVALGGPTPISGAGASGFADVQGFTERAEDRRFIPISYVSPGWFQTLGTPLLAGREFTAQDSERRVAIVNRTFARYYFGDQNPIGKRVTLSHVTMVPDARTYQIVGVVGDANYAEIREPAHRGIYVTAFHDGRASASTFLLHTRISPEAVTADVRRVVRKVSPGMSLSRTMMLADQINASIVPERLLATLSGFFGGLGVVLAGLGLYGLLGYTVARRTNEIGIRMALGATAGDVVSLVLRDALATVLVGLAMGVPLAMWGRSLVANLVAGLRSDVSWPVVWSAVALVVLAAVAATIPARRAARVDPVEALR